MNHTVVLEPRNHEVTYSPVKWEYGHTNEFLQGELKYKVGAHIRKLKGIKEHTFYLWYSFSWSFWWDITVVLESQNNYGSVEHNTVILHTKVTVVCTQDTMLHIQTITHWCEDDKKPPVSLQACVFWYWGLAADVIREVALIWFFKAYSVKGYLQTSLLPPPPASAGISESILSDQKCI